MKAFKTLAIGCLSLLASGLSVRAEAREYWVYLTPEKAAEIYQTREFSTIRNEADTYFLSSHFNWVDGDCLKSNTGHEHLLRKGIEIVSAVHFILLHGKYGGDTNASGAQAELTPYLNRAVKYWLSALYHGPAHLWTDCFDGKQVSCNCSGSQGWNEGDIALRDWLFGTIASYDAIRDFIPAPDRQAIDTWMAAVADKAFADNSFSLAPNTEHNRAMSRVSLANMFALVTQDRIRLEKYMADPVRGFSTIFQNFEGHFDYFEGCGGHWEHKPGISFEHNRRGSYGRGVIQHGFHTFANLATAARTGGNPSWDILNVATGAAGKHLEAMLDTWYDVATTDRSAYIAWIQCREGVSSPTKSTSSSLGAGYWTSFSFFDPRFVKLSHPDDWAAGPASDLHSFPSPALVSLWRAGDPGLKHVSPSGMASVPTTLILEDRPTTFSSTPFADCEKNAIRLNGG